MGLFWAALRRDSGNYCILLAAHSLTEDHHANHYVVLAQHQEVDVSWYEVDEGREQGVIKLYAFLTQMYDAPHIQLMIIRGITKVHIAKIQSTYT